MKNKELIKHLQMLDPELDIYVGEIKTRDSLKIQCISNIILRDSNFLNGIYLILNGNTPRGKSYINNTKPRINIEI